jgi:short-subunit dehydrogenase
VGLEYKEKNVIIFGGSNGVGLELAKKLLNQGAKVLIICKSKKNIQKAQLVLGKEKNYRIIIIDCYKFKMSGKIRKQTSTCEWITIDDISK